MRLSVRDQSPAAPEILITAIAATTQRIRAGSAGAMLPHYAALNADPRAAENVPTRVPEMDLWLRAKA